MSRFHDINVNSEVGTVEVGPGLTWDQVYEALEPTGVNVVGGRIPGVGVAGLTLGGGEHECPPSSENSIHMLSGYSYKSSQYGLTIDNVAGYELVLPNGTIINVTSNDDDLWFGLRVCGQAQYKLVSLRNFNCREG
jgi:FAD/FMN-containing dehydrogenase